MKNYSKIYLALIAAGVTFGAENAAAADCSPTLPVFFGKKASADFSNCQITQRLVQRYDDQNTETFFSVENSNLTTTNNTINITASPAIRRATLFSIYNSTLNINDSNLNMRTVSNNFIEARNSTANIKNTQFTSDSWLDDTEIFYLTNSTVTAEDSQFIAKDNEESEIVSFSSNSVSQLNLVNSTAKATLGIGSSWNLDNAVEHGDFILNLKNSEFDSQILASNSVYQYRSTEIFENITINAENSNLSGVMVIDKGYEKNATFNVTLTNSNWQFGNIRFEDEILESSVTNLALNNSTVTLNNENGFQTFTITSDLTGNGTFVMNTDLANQQSDKVVVQGNDSGSFELEVRDSGNEPNAENGKVTLVETQTGQAKFGLKDRDFVDAGAFRYRLAQEGNNWVLSNRNGERTNGSGTAPVTPVAPTEPTTPTNPTTPTTPTTPVVPVVPVVPVNPTTPSTPSNVAMLSERTNALVSLRQAQLLQVEQSLAGIHQRLGELKTDAQHNVWVRHTNSRQKLTALSTGENSQTSGFKQDYHSLQLGTDTALSHSVRLGGFVGTARSDVDFNGEYGSGKIRSQQFGGYITYLADNGFYWDNVYKYERLSTESAATDKQHNNANTVSTEIGRIHRLGSWTITPQLQAAWTHISGKANVDSLTAFYGRVGVRVANVLTFNRWTLQPYAEINGVASKNNNAHISVNQHRFDVASANTRLETALGLTAATGNHRFGIEGKISNGKRLDQPFAVQANYRFSW